LGGRKIPYEENHTIFEGVLYKKCNKHSIYFPNVMDWLPCTDDYFYKNSKNKTDGFYPYCRDCSILFAWDWQLDNMDRKIELDRVFRKTDKYQEWGRKHANEQRENGYSSKWRKNNPDKCIEYTKLHRNHDVSLKEEESMLKVFDYKCAYCGMTLDEHLKINKQKLHKEHVDDEGYNDLRNCIPACRSCNTGKHEYKIEEWFRKQKFFTEEKLQFIYWWMNEGYKDYIEEKLPYKISRKKDKSDDKVYYELWTVNEKRDLVECIATGRHKKDLDIHIKELIK